MYSIIPSQKTTDASGKTQVALQHSNLSQIFFCCSGLEWWTPRQCPRWPEHGSGFFPYF